MKSVVICINLLALAFIFYVLWKRNTSALRSWFWPSLVLHVVSGIGIGLLYFFYYKEGDTLSYFQAGKNVRDLAHQNFHGFLKFMWSGQASAGFLQSLYFEDHRAIFMAKLAGIANILSFNSYWVSSLYFSLISFFSAWKLANTLSTYFPSNKASIVFSFLLFPSVVFWSSGIVKESIALATLFYLVHVFLIFYKESRLRWHQVILLFISLWLLYKLKYYFLAVLLPVLLTSVLHKKLNSYFPQKNFLLQVSTWAVLFLLLSIGVTQLHPNFSPDRFLWVLYTNYQDFIAFSHAEDVLLFPMLQETWWSVIVHAPWAFVSGLFRPFLWESGTIFQTVAAVENLLLLILTLTSLPLLRSLSKHPDRMLLTACFFFCFILCVFLTLSTPNFGTLIRYRVGFLPFFVFLITASNPTFNRVIKFLSTRLQTLVGRQP